MSPVQKSSRISEIANEDCINLENSDLSYKKNLINNSIKKKNMKS